MKSQTTKWSKEIVIAAIHQLRIEYVKQAEACIALLIARYCNLLVNESTNHQEKQRWQDQASHWITCYQLNKKPRSHQTINLFLGAKNGR
jgi:hypothetical protein